MFIQSEFNFMENVKKKIQSSPLENEALQFCNIKCTLEKQKVKSYSAKNNGSFAICTTAARMSLIMTVESRKVKKNIHALDHIIEEYHRGLFPP